MNKTGVKFNKWQVIVLSVFVIALIGSFIYFFIYKNADEKITIDGEEYKVKEEFSYLLDNESTGLENKNLYAEQYNAWGNILKKYKNGNYTIDNPLVVYNPFEISPLSAIILFKTDVKESITLKVKGKHNDDLVTKFEASKDHYIPVYGLYEGTNNEVTITSSSNKSKMVKIQTLSAGEYEKGKVLLNNLKSNNEFYFATSSMGASTAAYDTYGELRWYTTRGYTKGMTMLKNGHMLISTDDAGLNLTSTSGVLEIDMLGYVYHEYVVDGGYHHDAYELENGNLIILTSNTKGETLADLVVELDRETGRIVKSWDLKQIVDDIDSEVTSYYSNWGWINSVYYDKTTDSLILSFRNQNSVVSLGYSSKKINWILGDQKYWGTKFKDYILKGTGDGFIYPMGQHSVNITEEGYLSVFNNGYNAYDEEPVTCASIKDNESYAMLYKIDANKKEASVVWKYGGNEYFSYALSSFTPATNNHRIFSSGWHFTDKTPFESKECTQYSAVTYETFIIDFDENKKEVFKMHINEGKFEVIKANIYNLESVSVSPKIINEIPNYDVKQVLMTSTIDYNYVDLSEQEIAKYKNAELLEYAMYADKNKIVINGILTTEDDVNVVLIDLQGHAYKFNVKPTGTDVLQVANANVLKKGRYYIFVTINDIIYNALQHINVV